MTTGKELTEKEISDLRDELSIEKDPFSVNLLEKRKHNLRKVKGFDINPELTKTNDKNDIVNVRKKNPENYEEWKVEKNLVYTSEKGFEIAALRPGKEAHEEYYSNSYYGAGKDGKSTDSKKEKISNNKYDFLPVILDKNKNIARRVGYQTHEAWRNGLAKEELVDLCKKEKINPYRGKMELVEKIHIKAKGFTKKELLELMKYLGMQSSVFYKRGDMQEFKLMKNDVLRGLVWHELLYTTNLSKTQERADKYLKNDKYQTMESLKKELKKKKVGNPKPTINSYTPWTLEHLALGLEKLKEDDCGKVALEIIGSLLVRMAHMLDHKKYKRSELYKLQIPKGSFKALKKLIPNGIMIENNYIDVDALLYFLDLLSNNEDVKSDWKGHTDLMNQDNMKHTPIGRVNTLLTYATFIALFINPDGNKFSKTLFQYHRTQNDPRTLEFYQDNFRFLKP